MDNFWVTQCGLIRFFTTVAMGMTITNCWKLFLYGVKRDYYDVFIDIRELSERIAADCFNNTFTTDTGTLSNNIPSLGDIDNKVTVSTYQSLNYSSSYPRNSEISEISDITITTDPTTFIGHMASK